MKKFLIITLPLIFSAYFTNAQSPIQPKWSHDFNAAVTWQKVTPLGQVIAATATGLKGINPETGAELWNIETLKNSPENSYVPIEHSPFVTVSSAGGRDIYIIDPFEGKVLFSSAAAGLDHVTDQYFLYRNNKVLVIGTKGGNSTEVVMADMGTGQKLWSKSGPYSFTTAAYDLPNDEVLITSAFFASKLNASTGEEIWKTPIDPRTAGFASLLGNLEGLASKKLSKEEVMAQLIVPPSKPDMFLIAAQKKNESTKIDSKGAKSVSITYSSVYMAFDIATGKHKWGSVTELKYPLGITYAANEGLIAASSAGGNLNMLNYNDGTTMLGKKGSGLNLKGPAAGIAPLSNGKLLIVSDLGGSSSITLLVPQQGILLFDKSARMKGAVTYTELLPSGVLIGSDREVNMLNTATGDWYFPDAIEGGASLITGSNEKIYIFNAKDGIVYQMDVNGTALSPLGSTPVKFQGKESPSAIEVTANGILLTSDQNLALVDQSGAVKFNRYFPAPTNSALMKALLIANAVRAAYYTAAMATYSAAFGAASQSIQVKDASSRATKEITADVSQVLGQAAVTGSKYTASYIKRAQERFKATTHASDYMLIMSAESKNDIRLLQVSKADGSVMNSISLGKDKEPVYDVDLVEGRLYYMKAPAKMECFKF